MPKVQFGVFILIALLYLLAIRVDTMDIDASQYAEMSREMMRSGDWLHLYDRGADYLDKPPFLFWASSASMRIFGENNFGYKLPSLLFALLAIYATYRLARILYDDATGRVAAIVLATSQGVFLMTNDVRCDTILMGWVAAATWQIAEWQDRGRLFHLLAGAGCVAFGMMTKGPIALLVPVFAFSADWILKRAWKNFFRLHFLPALVIIGLLLVPMSIGLYQQFDMHPEKTVNGTTGVSGLRFFFWTQSFGRITGESPWNNGANIAFLLQNMLWSFLPWVFIFLAGIILNIIQLVRQRFRLRAGQEWVTTGGFLLTYLALGSSAYQLPHYIFVAFPLAAIVTARFMTELMTGTQMGLHKFFRISHIVITLLLLVASLALIVFVFPAGFPVLACWGLCFAGWLFLLLRRSPHKLLWLPAAGICVVNIFLSGWFYPRLLQYQAGSQAGRYIRGHNIDPADVAVFRLDDPLIALHFYARGIVKNAVHAGGSKYVLTCEEGVYELQQERNTYDTLLKGDYFKVSELTGEFLNPATRTKATRKYYLLRLRAGQ